MNKTRYRGLLVASAGIFAGALAVSAAVQTIQPPPSDFIDTEASVNVPIPTNEGRHIKLTLAFESSPTNAVVVSLGRDTNGDGDLAPEETVERVGVDCGEYAWNGHLARSAGQPERAGCHHSSDFATQSDLRSVDKFHVFDLKQPIDPAKRWNLAKVTTHNTADTNVTVTAKFYKPGLLIIVK